MELTRIYAKKDKVVARTIAGEDLLIPVRGMLADMQKIYVQEGIGRFIWDRIDGSTDLTAIVHAVRDSYEVDDGEATRDVEEFMEGLESAGLVQVVP